MPVIPGEIEDRRRRLPPLFNDAPIARLLGMRLSYDGETAVMDLPFNTDLDHAMGATHGGVIATMLDNAGWFTLAPYFPTWIATVEFQVRLHEPAVRQHLQARGRVVRMGARLSVADMEVRTLDGTLVATGSGTFSVTALPYTWPEP